VTAVRLTLPQPYRDLDHTADVGVEVTGASAEETLARLVLAQSTLLTGGELVAPGPDARVAVASQGGLAALSVELLRELLFRFATGRVLPGACEVVRLDASAAEVVVALGPYDPVRHAEGLDLKAVTRHGARFDRVDGGWRAQVIFDI